MSNTIIANRYGAALFEIAKEKGMIDSIQEEARAVKEVFSSNHDFLSFLGNPKITKEQKKQLLSDAFSTTSQDFRNTINLMLDRDRVEEIAPMAAHVIELVNEEKSVAEAAVYTTRPLTDAERESISSVFAAKIGKKSLHIDNIVNPELIGGIKLRIGNRIYDGSISGKLERLEKQLLN
ncbi:F0F1 ATP synthase subunit delta [Bacillus testis]|uniref:F0F1 ATP synthase subunit delta n=1 Tax=Bacillus testis TaxID=1622072 RepID=UPI00067E756F|nr:F0F1 ATP synthase subunit delta [Bacillus testis]